MLQKINGHKLAASLWALVLGLFLSVNAHAQGIAGELPATADLTDFYAVAGFMVGALVVIWALRKALGFFGR